MPATRAEPPPPGSECASERVGILHRIEAPEDDGDLQAVAAWLWSHPLENLLRGAVQDAIDYVLDGARTWRFDLNAPEVDSDERRTVGTKLQYRVLAALDLVKEPPLDTTVVGIPVELKATVGSGWMIPREGQCEICLLVQVDTLRDLFRASLMRTHRAWLREGANQDRKRGIQAAAFHGYSVSLVDWAPLPVNPLKALTPEQVAVVFHLRDGQSRRLTALFGYLPEVVIPRSSILTVCANRDDPMRRAREIKERVFREHGLWLLCGKWRDDLDEGRRRGFDLSGAAWVAVRP